MRRNTTSASDGWRLDADVREEPSPDYDAVPYLRTDEQWKNYYDQDTYELEQMLRSFIEYNIEEGCWRKTGKKYNNLRRYTMPMMFELLYGRKYEKKDFGLGYRLSRLMRHYSGRIQKEGSVRGRKVHHYIYSLSPTRYKKAMPYSLRLRIEWLLEQGRTPNMHNMYEYADDLQPGHARNPRTDYNMALRREQGRAKNAEYQRKLKEEHDGSHEEAQ